MLYIEMRIDTNNKILYLANPKTGSTSLRKLMDKKSNCWPLLNQLKKNNLFHDHWSINEYKDILIQYDIDTRDYFSFTTIRNPWDRMVSAFKYQKCDINGNPWYVPEHDKKTAGKYTFKNLIKDLDTSDYWCGIGIQNCYYFCFNENNEQVVTKIYPIETLTNKIINNDIFNHCGINYDVIEIPHLNTTKKTDYRTYYTEQWMIDKVAKVFEKDIEIGKYVF